MSQTKQITISIPIEAFERVERVSPRKKWGTNDVRDFYTSIFMQGLESSEFLRKEMRSFQIKIKLLEASLKSAQDRPVDCAAIDLVVRDVLAFEEMPNKAATETPDAPDQATSPQVADSASKLH